MATSLPRVPADPAPPTPILTERLARLDGCIDACGNSELPYRTEYTPDGFVAYYGCEDCGQFWSTSWRD